MKKKILKKQNLKIKKSILKSLKNVKIFKRSKKKKENADEKYTKIYIKKPFMIFILIALYIYLFDINKIFLKHYQAKVLPEIKSFQNSLPLNYHIFDKYLKINSENKLIEENQNFIKSPHPDVSIIMTMYNQAHCIYKAIRSVQNQSIKNLEIIIIDDCSEDNSTDVIKEFQKEDPRIILISHDTNEGKIKSRADGIRKAKGKYITVLDGDDQFIQKDILNHSMFIAEKGKFDVVEYRVVSYWKRNIEDLVGNEDNKDILYQPELRTRFTRKSRRKHYYLYNTIICGKFIKNKILQKVLNYIGTEYIDDYNNEAEDVIMALGVYHTAKSYYRTNEIGYYYSKREKLKEYPKTKIGKCKINNKLKNFGYFKVTKFMVDKNNKNDKEKSMILGFMRFISIDKSLVKIKFDDRHYKILFYIYDTILGYNCWNEEQKNYIMSQKDYVMKCFKKKKKSL